MSPVESDGARYAVHGRVEGSILPTTMLDLERTVTLGDGTDVHGAILAAHVVTEAHDIYVAQSVYATDEVRLVPSGGRLTIDAPIAARKGILLDGSAASSATVGGDLVAPKVRLVNAVVAGSVIATEAVIRDSVVLGAVRTSGRCVLDNSYVGTFIAGSTQLTGRCIVGGPAALSYAPIELTGASLATGVLLDLQRICEGGLDGGNDLIEFVADDIRILRVNSADAGERVPAYFLSVAPRALNLEPYCERMQANRSLLTALGMRRHTDPRDFTTPVPSPELVGNALLQLIRGRATALPRLSAGAPSA